MSETMRVSGQIWGLFGHRFALDGADGKVLIDLGPEGIKGLALEVGDTVTVVGRRKPSEIKASRITLADGIERPVAWPDKHEGPADPAAALAAVQAAGYATDGPPRRKPKHFEIDAVKDGRRHEFHVGLAGEIRKIRERSPATEA